MTGWKRARLWSLAGAVVMLAACGGAVDDGGAADVAIDVMAPDVATDSGDGLPATSDTAADTQDKPAAPAGDGTAPADDNGSLDDDGGPVACDCTGRECGDDGCGGSCGTCPVDSMSCVAGLCVDSGPSCEDGSCDEGEDCDSCPADCGACPTCGDGACNGDETCESCVPDCGGCSICGDGVCSDDELCDECEEDCGACPYCDDGACNGDESCETCTADCGPCLSEGACTNPADLFVLQTIDVSGLVFDAGLACFVSADPGGCAQEKIVVDTGLTEACVGCYVEMLLCVISQCMADCAPPNEGSDACSACSDEQCMPSFEPCSGLAF